MKKKLRFRLEVIWCRGDAGGKTPPKIFFRHYLVVHFRLPVKKLRFRFKVMWYRGDAGGKTTPYDFLQVLPSSAF